MDSRSILILSGLGALGLLIYSQSSSANIDGSGSGSGSGDGSGFDFSTLIGSITDSLKNAATSAENLIMGNTRGERNNNPGNLMYSVSIPWLGQVGSDPGGYAIFDSPEHGLRAMFIDLKTKISRGLNTLNTLIPVYAPPSENPTATYIANVSAWTGFPPNALLTPANVPILAQAMIQMENGEMIYNQSQLAYAAQSAGVG